MGLLKYSLNKIKNRIRRRKFLSLVFLIIFLVLVIWFSQSFFSKVFDSGYKASLIKNHAGIIKLLPLYRKIRKISDIIYFPYYFKKNNLSEYELFIEPQDRRKMEESLPDGFTNVIYSDKVYVPAKFKYQGKTYDVRVRYRGDNAVHWNAPKKSYLVKFDKDDLFNGIRRLSFIILDDRYFVLEEFNNYRADKLGLMRPQSQFGNLSINSKNNGLYFIIESWSKEMLAKWEVPEDSNFYSIDDPDLTSAISRDYSIWENTDRWKKLVDDNQFNYDHFTEINRLLKLFNQSNDEEFFNSIFNLIDEENFYSWQIHQELIHSNHQAYENARLYFNNSSGKFYFIPWDVGNTSLSTEFNLYSQLAKRIFSNPYYLFEKNKRLYDYVSNAKNLEADLKFYDQIYNSIKADLYQDRMKVYTNRWADKIIAEKRQDIIDIFNSTKDLFKESLIFVDFNLVDDNTNKFNNQYTLAFFDINIESVSDLFLKDVDVKLNDKNKLENYKLYYDSNDNEILDQSDILIRNAEDALLFTKRIFDDITEKGILVLTKHRFYIIGNQITSSDFSDKFLEVDFDFENAITKRNIKDKKYRVRLMNESIFKDFSKIANIDLFEKENPIFRVNQNKKEIVLPAGTYNINKNIIVPKGFTLKILPFTTLRFAPEVSLISYSNVIAEGTKDGMINFISQGEKPWGVFAVLNADKESIFDYSQFSNGKDDYINGVYFSGMLSVYHSDVDIKNSKFSNAQADDGLNVKYGKASLVKSNFIDNSADAVDYDFIKEGKITDNYFFRNGNDGIDISGSSILISENIIKDSGDKCISIGEKTLNTIVYNNVLDNCNVGIEIKDLSKIDIINNIIINNQIGVNAYQKKPVFGGGQGRVYNSIIWYNKKDIQVDKKSEVLVFNSDISSINENQNFSLKPIFSNPEAGDYTIINQDDEKFFNGGDKEIIIDKLSLELDNAPVGLIN